MSMEEFRCVRFGDVAAIVDAMKTYDDGFTNSSLGTLLDSRSATTEATEPAYLLGLYRGEALLLTLAGNATDSAWQLVYPQQAAQLMTLEFLDFATNILAKELLKIARPNVVGLVFGHEDAVNAFLKAWAAQVDAVGVHFRLMDPALTVRSSYATRDTLPPLPPSPSSFVITQAVESELDELFPLYLDFKTYSTGPRARDVEAGYLRSAIASGLTWVCRVEDTIAGYILHGRITPRTIAIRNVYVSPSHRRKGVAEALVRAMTRHYLGVQPVGYQGVPDGPPFFGVKDIVCINVADPSAERLYRRTGFLFPEHLADGSTVGGRDPVTGRKAWFLSTLRGLQLDSAPSTWLPGQSEVASQLKA